MVTGREGSQFLRKPVQRGRPSPVCLCTGFTDGERQQTTNDNQSAGGSEANIHFLTSFSVTRSAAQIPIDYSFTLVNIIETAFLRDRKRSRPPSTSNCRVTEVHSAIRHLHLTHHGEESRREGPGEGGSLRPEYTVTPPIPSNPGNAARIQLNFHYRTNTPLPTPHVHLRLMLNKDHLPD